MTALGEFSSPELAARSGCWDLLIPFGSVEQHGPHLPVDTDVRIAEEVARRAAAAVADAVVSPPLPIGAAGEHAGFSGTLSVGTETAAGMLVEIVRSAGPEWRSITLVNGHGGNLEALRLAQRRCRAEGRELRCWWPRDPGGDAHAGFTETSVMLALAPDAVRREALAAGPTAPLAELLDELTAGGVAAVSSNGVLGDPRQASAEAGRAILDRWVEELVADLATESERPGLAELSDCPETAEPRPAEARPPQPRPVEAQR